MGKVSYYFDEMMSRTAANQLLKQGVEVVLANDVGMTGQEDSKHLEYAIQNGLIMVTFDRPFVGRTAKSNQQHKGLICLSSSQDDIGYIVRTLAEVSQMYSAESCEGLVLWL
jgi:predicted nuclease of predicted toxin-antitoxin system